MSEKQERKVTVAGRLLSNPIKVNDNGKHKAMIVFDPEYIDQKKIDGYLKQLEALKKSAVEEVFDGKKVKVTDWVVRYGDDPEFENTFEKHYLAVNSNKPFRNVKRVNGEVVDIDDDDADEFIYAGAVVALPVNVYAMKKKDDIPNHVNVSSRGTICFLKHADKLSTSNASDDEFDDFESTENDDDFDDGSFD